MNSEVLFNCITALPDELVEEAAEHRFRKPSRLLRYAGLAAAVVLVVGGVVGLLSGRNPLTPHTGVGSGGGGSGEGGGARSYMHYVGPVLPLTALDGAEGVTAERSVNYDFAPYRPVMHSYEHNGQTYSYDASRREAIVTDSYVLTNETDADRTLRLVYGAEGRFNDALDRLPEITVDGAKAETVLHPAAYSGAFADATGRHSETERLNLEEIRSWDGYAALLGDGRYQESAFAELPTLDFPVTVYRIDGYELGETDAPNPSLQISFSLTDDNALVLTYGSNGGSNDYETGRYSRIVGRVNDLRTAPMYLIVCGGDLAEYKLQGYRSGGANVGEELEITASVTRYETTMDAMLRMAVDAYMGKRSYLGIEGGTVADSAPRELLYGTVADLLVSYGALSASPAGRYSFGMLEEVLDAFAVQRILYQAFEVTVPAHGSVLVTATMHKEASYDYTGDLRGADGYDLATQLGSTLRFTSQRASVSAVDAVEILDNNFGFDPDAGISEVTLDPGTEHYWMQVRKR